MSAARTLLVRSALAFGLLSCPLACGGPTFIVQQYDGAVRDRETISVLRFAGDGTVQLVVLDGERADTRVAEDARLHIELLPGKHTMVVQNLATPDVPAPSVSFTSEAGKTYRAVFVNSADGRPLLHAYEVDDGTDALLRDVTSPP